MIMGSGVSCMFMHKVVTGATLQQAWLAEDNLSVAGSPRWDGEAAGAELYFSHFLDEAKLNRRTG